MIPISKSAYIRGLQCEKSLYLNFFHQKHGINKDVLDTKAFEIGHSVGKYAQLLFPGGVDYSYSSTRGTTKSVELTKQAILDNKQIIYEAAFEFEKLLCFADILVKDGDEWLIYEVKSSTEIKDYYIDDVSFQYYVISKHIKIKDVIIVYLDNQYIKNGKIEVDKLFKSESVLKEVLQKQDDVKKFSTQFINVTEMKAIPDIRLGKHCKNPLICEFQGYCWKDVPEHSVFNISNMRGKEFDLYNAGIVDLENIPTDFNLNDKQWLEVNSFLQNKDFFDKNAISKFVNSISYPLYFMDFETYWNAIPELDNTRPYQQIPFQFSLYYRKTKMSKAHHYSYLGNPLEDPRKDFIENLVSKTSDPGIILVYNAGFEQARIKELARDFPQYSKQLTEINERIIDLMNPFRQKLYYKPSMKGSYSMKAVLPAINSKYSYDNLNIKDGAEAGNEYLRLRSITDTAEVNKVRKDLIDYCERDTYGMVIILNELETMVSKTYERILHFFIRRFLS